MKELRLSEIWIYPIKSLGGIKLSSAEVLEKGLRHDRRWMLIDGDNVFMTQRVYPQMALFKPVIRGNVMHVSKSQAAASSDHITIDIGKPLQGDILKTKVWDDEVDVIEVDREISEWFSLRLGISCKLVGFPEEHSRPVDPKYRVHNEHVSLADAYPFLIVGQSSLDDLNVRLATPIPMNRFRPNFVFTGGDPYEEDTWSAFSIGDKRFVGVKPCARCAIPTIDQETAKKGIEPSLALSKYRKHENKVFFGQNVVAVDHGVVSVGDLLTLG